MPKSANQLYLFSVIRSANEEDDHASIAACIKGDFQAAGAKDYIFQLERGTTAGKLHWQCYLKLQLKSRIKTLLNLLNEPYQDPSPTPYRVKPCSLRGAQQLKSYCMKTATAVGHLTTLNPVYRGEDLAPMENPFPWQSQLLSILDGNPDDRTIRWVYNPRGCIGKSLMCKWLEFNKKATAVPMGSAQQIKTYIIASGAARVYLIDLPRTRGKAEAMEDIMSAIEEIKNGNIKSAMYGKIQRLMMSPPHVICFSNHPPPTSMASPDRWKIYVVRRSQDSLQRYTPGDGTSPIFVR